jgi:hypothetical protein
VPRPTGLVVKKGSKSLPRFRGDARAAVAKIDPDLIALLLACTRRLQLPFAGLFGGIGGVLHQVHDHLLHLTGRADAD